MVASAKNRKVTSSVNVHLTPNPSQLRNPDGRRQLFGLSQAIREKAFQSTSPRSEENNSTTENYSRRIALANQKKPKDLTLEDKFRNLFNSDTEEVNNLIASKDRSKNADSNGVGKTSSENKIRDKISFFGTDEKRIGAKSHATRIDMIPQRRCISAVPNTFNDTEWNKVPSGPIVSSNIQSRIKSSPNTYVNLPWTTETRSPHGFMPRPNSAAPYQNGQAVIENNSKASYKPVPIARKSLYHDKDDSQPRSTPNLNPTGVTSPQDLRLSFQARTNDYIHGTTFVHAAPLATAQAVSQQQQVVPKETRPLNQKLIYLPRNPTVNGNARIDLNQSRPPVAVSSNSDSRGRMQYNETKSKNDYIPSSTQVPSVLTKKPYPRDHYPQQNFSFRRAVHRSLSSESEKVQNNAKRNLIATPDLPQEGDKSSRKSDDRDSGTVVEPEASVFDFDSSVLSEDEKEIQVHNRSIPTQSQETPTEDDSRTCTPILPPLTTEDEFTDVAEEDQTTLPNSKLLLIQPNEPHKNQAVSPSRIHQHNFHASTSGVAELSTTESAIHESPARRSEQKSKFGAVKPPRVTSSGRRSYYGRIPSGDEKRQKKSKSRSRRIHDDSDVTDCSTHRASYRPPSNRRGCTCSQSYKNPYCSCLNLAKDKSELGETSSVRSMTTTSVCSSVLRRSGSKRRHYRKYYGGSEKHLREIKSLSKRVSLLEGHVVSLARNFSQFSTELRHQNVTNRDVELLRQHVNELNTRLVLGESPKPHKHNKLTSSLSSKGGNNSKKNKLEKFFGGQSPPLLHMFLKELGYEKYIKNFENESIGMMELPYLDEKRLQTIGIPLGPRIRIMKEAQKSSYV